MSIDPATLTLEAQPGSGAHIDETCREAQRISDSLRVRVAFRFNGMRCIARPDGDYREIVKNYDLMWQQQTEIKDERTLGRLRKIIDNVRHDGCDGWLSQEPRHEPAPLPKK